jgi:two-component system, cell cycle response regulator DivK
MTAMRLVLIADDSEDSRDMYQEFLEFSGFEVLTAFDGLGVLRVVADRVPDVIVLDMGMPHLDGWETARRLRAEEATCKTPIIAVTGHALTGTEATVKAAGCDVYLMKPLLPERLAEEVRRLLTETDSSGK